MFLTLQIESKKMAKNDIKNFYKNNNISDEELTDFIKYNQDNKIPVNLKNDRKIDLVYCWCDASDEQFREKKNYWLKKLGISFDEFVDDCRWRDNDELRYSLRSVEKFIPWINHIYIVTDNQVPYWLDTDNPKITIVDHKDIIPEEYLPTFNSDIITCFVPYIKGLSEYFILSDDDCFVNDYLKPSYFFTDDGKPILNQKYLKPKDGIYSKKIKMANDNINKLFKTKYSLQPAHQMWANKKSLNIDNFNNPLFKDKLYEKFRYKFRSDKDLFSYFNFTLYNNIRNKNIFRVVKNQTLLDKILKRPYEFLYIVKHYKNILKYKPKLFCINDEPGLSDEDREKNKRFLEQYFNVKSSFEK